jgi:hypothetical protein
MVAMALLAVAAVVQLVMVLPGQEAVAVLTHITEIRGQQGSAVAVVGTAAVAH